MTGGLHGEIRGPRPAAACAAGWPGIHRRSVRRADHSALLEPHPSEESTGIANSVRPKRRVGRGVVTTPDWDGGVAYAQLEACQEAGGADRPADPAAPQGPERPNECNPPDGYRSPLNPFAAVAVLTDGTRSSKLGSNERVGGDDDITTADADRFIHPDRSLSQLTAQHRLQAARAVRKPGGRLKGKRRVSQGQASQRVTTSSMDPS